MEDIRKNKTEDLLIILKELEDEYEVLKKKIVADLDRMKSLEHDYLIGNEELKRRLNK